MDVDDYATSIIAAHERDGIRRIRTASQQDHVIFYRKRGEETAGPIILRDAPSRERTATLEEHKVDTMHDRWATASTTADGTNAVLGNDDGLMRQALEELKQLR